MVVVWDVENNIISGWWIGIDLVLVQRSKTTFFSARIEINWVFMSEHRNRLDIRAGIKID